MKRVIFILTSLLLSVSFLQAQTSSYFGDLKGTKGLGYQGMDIYGNYLVSCQHTGMTTIYDISKGKPEMLSQFNLDSHHENNHCNVVTFGVEKAEKSDVMPLVYVSQCHKKPVNDKKDVLYVERMLPGLKSSELVQTIFYDDVNKDFGYALQWVIDTKNKMLYGYGNTINNNDPANRHRVIKFHLPKLSDGEFVVLKSEDALENYTIEEVSDYKFNPIGQGLSIYNGKLYMPTGFGSDKEPSILYIWNLETKTMETVDLSKITKSEFEDIAFYKKEGKGKTSFIIQSQAGLYKITL
jgi:hypothetical protein